MLGWSLVITFKTLPAGTDWSPRLCLYGDLGNANAMSLGYIQEELTRDDFDAILHVGRSSDYIFFKKILERIDTLDTYQLLNSVGMRTTSFSHKSLFTKENTATLEIQLFLPRQIIAEVFR
jgi:hypothetical protein